MYALVNAHLQGQTLTDAQVEITKRFTLELRLEMNGIVGIRTQEKWEEG